MKKTTVSLAAVWFLFNAKTGVPVGALEADKKPSISGVTAVEAKLPPSRLPLMTAMAWLVNNQEKDVKLKGGKVVKTEEVVTKTTIEKETGMAGQP